MYVCDVGPVPFPAYGADRISDVVIIRHALLKVSCRIRRTVVVRRKKPMSWNKTGIRCLSFFAFTIYYYKSSHLPTYKILM